MWVILWEETTEVASGNQKIYHHFQESVEVLRPGSSFRLQPKAKCFL
jgi:hypothetical protein